MSIIEDKSLEVSELESSDSIRKGINSLAVRQDSVLAFGKEEQHPGNCQSFIRVINRRQELSSTEGKIVILL